MLRTGSIGDTSIDRLLIVLGVAAGVAAGVFACRAWTASRFERLRAATLWDALGEAPRGGPVVVAFSTASCGVCRTAQKPALRALAARIENVRIIEIDAGQRPEVARTFGVVTVPTTVLLGKDGNLIAANNGFAPLERLLDQLGAVASAA